MKEKLNELLLAAQAICGAAEKEKRDFTDDEREKVGQLLADAAKLREQIKQAEGDAAMRQAVLDMGAGVELAERPKQDPGRGAPAGRGKSIGQQFVEAPAFVEWMKRVAPGGRIPDGARGLNSPGIMFKDLLTGADPTSAGAFVQTDYTGIYEPLGRYPLTVLALINRRTTTSDLVEFVRQTRKLQAAAPTPEANVKIPTGATGEITGEKPQGGMTFEKVQAAVKTIPVWVAATKRALSDVGELRGLIDQELRDDIAEEFEDQILNGDGVGENFTGIMNTAGVLTQAFNADILTTTRQAVTTLEVTGLAAPTAWVFHPTDWETIELLRDSDGRFYYGGPAVQGPRQLWGYPVVKSHAKTQGSAIIADWRKAIIWDRQSTTISVSDSHSDFFIRNLVAILAEMRSAFGLIRPSAFCEVELS
jgi:HK97 family phage major capsid protein